MEPTMKGSWIMTPITVTAATATGSTAAFSIGTDALDGCFVVNVTTLTATTPLLDINLQTSPDAGTTYFTVARFARITATGANRLIVSFNASGQNTATVVTNAGGGNSAPILTTTTNSALSAGCPIIGAYMRFNYVIGGTSPSFTFKFYGWGNLVGRGLANA